MPTDCVDDTITVSRRPRKRLPEINLPNGDVLVPRADFAANEIGCCERSVKRINLPTTFVGGVAYVAKRASLEILAATVRRRNEAPKRRRRAA